MCIRDRVNFLGKANSNLADIGGGRGDFARAVSEHFSSVDVFDHDAHGCDGNIKFRTCDLNEEWKIPESSYDIVVSLEVIEHLENPRHFFRQIAQILKEGGIAVVTTPNQVSLSSKICLLARDQFIQFQENCYPAHITSLVPADLIHIANEANFELLEIVYSNDGRIPLTRRRWQQLSRFFSGKRFSDNVAIVVKKPQTKPA